MHQDVQTMSREPPVYTSDRAAVEVSGGCTSDDSSTGMAREGSRDEHMRTTGSTSGDLRAGAAAQGEAVAGYCQHLPTGLESASSSGEDWA